VTSDDLTSRYARAIALSGPRAAALLRDAAPPRIWLETDRLAFRVRGEERVVELATGEIRAATEAEASRIPTDPPPRKDLHEAPAPAAVVGSPDGRWGIGQHEGNVELHDLGAPGADPMKLSTDGSVMDGYGVHYGNWKAGFIGRSRTPEPHPPMGVMWAPDSRRVIIPRVDLTGIEPYPFLETVPQDGSIRPKVHYAPFPLTGEELPGIDWYVFDVIDGSSVRVDLPQDLLSLHQDLTALRTVTFSSDATHAYVVAHGAHMRSAHLFDVDLMSGAVREVVGERAEPRMDLNTSSYMPPNVAVIGDLEQVVWFSQRDGWGHLYLYDGMTGDQIRQLTSGDWLVRDLIGVDAEGRRIYFTAAGREPGNPYHRKLYRVDLDGSEPVLLTPEDGDVNALPGGEDILGRSVGATVVSPDHSHVVYSVSDVQTPEVTIVRRTSDGGLVATIAEADATALLDAGYVPPTPVVTTAADGVTELHGLLYRPADFDETRQYPLLVVQYASPLMAATPRTYAGAIAGPANLIGVAGLVQLGCACIVIDARGTTGRSRAFAEAGHGKLNVIGLDDYVAAIEQLGAQHGWLDTSRVGIMGGSYGGFTTIRAMIEFPDVFTVGIADVPLALPHFIYPDYHWFAFHGVPDFDGSPNRPDNAAVPTNYEVLDATKQVDRITGRLLLVVGELDENCPPNGIMPFVLACYEADRDVDLLFVPNANHYSIGRTPYVMRRHLDYLARHLIGETPASGIRLDDFDYLPEPAVRTSPNVW